MTYISLARKTWRHVDWPSLGEDHQLWGQLWGQSGELEPENKMG